MNWHRRARGLVCALLVTGVAGAQAPAPVCVEAPGGPGPARTAHLSSLELRWDDAEPTGFMALAEGDLACVVFPGMPGMRLDSVRVALRRAGSVTGAIHRGGTTANPVGAPVSSLFPVSGTDTPPIPYPIPWPQWAVADLHAEAIGVDSAFAVVFHMQGDPLTGQRLMVTPEAGGVSHSRTYLSTPGAYGPTGWYTLPVDSTHTASFAYLVRAYVSPVTSVEPAATLPTMLSLAQNWPNPFNAGTTIAVTMGESGRNREKVTLTVCDLLGRTVATLWDGMLGPGRREFRFDGARLASGVYLYRLVAGGQVFTRSMILLR